MHSVERARAFVPKGHAARPLQQHLQALGCPPMTASGVVSMLHALRLVAAIAWVAAASSASATVTEVAQSVANGASSVVTKAERAVKHGVNAAASGVEKGTKAAGHATENTARKIGLPASGASAPKK